MKITLPILIIGAAVTAVLLAIAVDANAAPDDWRGPDKAKHIEVSAVAGLVSAVIINEPGAWNWKAYGLAMAPGLAKEVYDARHRGGSGFSGRDLAADALGASVGVAAGQRLFVRVGRGKASVALTGTFD